jgi:hypothetical protein
LWRCCGLAPRGYFSQGMMKALHIGLHRERQLAGIIGYAVARLDGDPVAFGGIWEEWESPADETLRTFATIRSAMNFAPSCCRTCSGDYSCAIASTDNGPPR